MGFSSKESYKQHAIKFANAVDKTKNITFIDPKTMATYKFNKTTNEFAIITKKGYVVTYYILDGGINRFNRIKKEKIGGKKRWKNLNK